MVYYHKLSEDIHKKISEEYRQGNMTMQEIGKEYNISSVQVSKILKKFKISIDYRRGCYNVNTSYFKQIDSPNKAYFIGLFHADGCNSTYGAIRISLQEEDFDILNKLKEDIQFSGPIKYIKKYGNRKNQYSLNIVSKEISNDLIKLGYPPNKTFKVMFPRFIPQLLIKHFIRGFFDGDGCLYNKHTSFSLVGTLDTLTGIKEYFLNSLNINSVISESKTKQIYRLTISKKENIFRVLQHLYSDSCNLYLQRKYKLFEKLFIVEKEHLYWQIYCKNIKTEEVIIFKNLQEAKQFFNLKTYSAISYCINKSKNKIFRKTYYINLLKNE